jgi:hypothetical protein
MAATPIRNARRRDAIGPVAGRTFSVAMVTR